MGNKIKTILVSGDPIWDINLIKSRDIPSHHREMLDFEIVNESPGGVSFLCELIKEACSDVSDQVHIEQSIINDYKYITKAYQLWSKYPRVDDKGRNPEDEVFRIEQFLGCYKPKFEDNQNLKIVNYKDMPDPDLLVIDDLGLGFCQSDKDWPKALKDAKNLKNIILKTSSPLVDTYLWDHLKDNKLISKLTLIIRAESLRVRGALISKALSWDQTIEDLIHEFKEGISSQDIAQCRRIIITFGDEAVASVIGSQENQNEETDGKAKLERFIYNPNLMEGDWESKRRGRVFGSLSIVTSVMVRHELKIEDRPYPLYIALSRALEAICKTHEDGAGKDFSQEQFFNTIKQTLHTNKELVYCSTIDHSLLDENSSGNQDQYDLVKDSIGDDFEYVYAKAMDVVLFGPEKALAEIPKVIYGKYLTVDKEEIQSINAIRNLIQSYIQNPKDNRPLSIAVFGTPGSGKTFAIKQLVSSLLGEKVRELSFNLSQFNPDSDDLIEAFHRVRDASIESQFPLVFWDEFDTDDLEWLKHFLVPMEESKFHYHGILHPFGKTIFVFAGGVCPSFDEFSRGSYKNSTDNKNKYEDFKKKKGPDFISRLRGYVNIKGPNPYGIESCTDSRESSDDEKYRELSQKDIAYLLRRAIILRASLQELMPSIIGKDKMASISTGVIRGFLLAKKYLHGSRSINTIVRMSSISSNQKHFSASQLPSDELLKLHVSEDFIKEVTKGELEKSIIEELAKACHTSWKTQKENEGWKYGPKRIDDKKIHNLLVDYDELDEKDKEERNRKPARMTKAKIIKAGCKIVKKGEENGMDVIHSFKGDVNLSDQIKIIEHDIWLREHLIKGYEYAEKTDESLRLHRCATKFKKMLPEDKKLDDAIVNSFIPALEKFGYLVVRDKQTNQPTKTESM
ncbi:TPA: hypothetical protein ENX78_13510 [Candidatus Poribacteria bacterium]|nr:hypothetical protein [Candidatus Poribacteria bacterium]